MVEKESLLIRKYWTLKLDDSYFCLHSALVTHHSYVWIHFYASERYFLNRLEAQSSCRRLFEKNAKHFYYAKISGFYKNKLTAFVAPFFRPQKKKLLHSSKERLWTWLFCHSQLSLDMSYHPPATLMIEKTYPYRVCCLWAIVPVQSNLKIRGGGGNPVSLFNLFLAIVVLPLW